MDKRDLEQLLSDVADGAVAPEVALTRIQTAPTADLGFAQLDLSRGVRQGAGEVVYGAGKTAEQIAAIIKALRDAGQERILVTRLDAEKATRTSELLDNGIDLGYIPDAQLALVGGKPSPTGNGRIVVACAGTSDLPVAEEAALTAEFYGNEVDRLYDVGVAGLHRLLAHAEELTQAQVVIAIAGMEGALASVIGGLVSCPGHRRSHQRGLRRKFWRRSRAARHAQLLRQRRFGRQYRQWLWCRLPGKSYQSSERRHVQRPLRSISCPTISTRLSSTAPRASAAT